jgi:hypothetical protein
LQFYDRDSNHSQTVLDFNRISDLFRILRKIAEKKGNSVVVTVCVMGIRNGTYTVLLCNSDRLQGGSVIRD